MVQPTELAGVDLGNPWGGQARKPREWMSRRLKSNGSRTKKKTWRISCQQERRPACQVKRRTPSWAISGPIPGPILGTGPSLAQSKFPHFPPSLFYYVFLIEDASLGRVMSSIFKASALPRAGCLCRPTVRSAAATCPTAASLAYPRPTTRHLQTNRPDAAGIWKSSKLAASPSGKGGFTRGHRLASTSTPTEPQLTRRWSASFCILLFDLLILNTAVLVWELSNDDTWLVPNILETFDPDNRPPELVRMFIQTRSSWGPIPSDSRMADAMYRPCVCHLDGLVTIMFTGPDQLKSPVVPARMSVWLQTARVMEEEEEGGGFRARGTAITLYAAIDTPRGELEGPDYRLQSWEPWQKWVQYEGPIVECLAREEAKRKEVYPPSDTTYSVVVVCRDGFMIFEYDGKRLRLRTDGGLGPVQRKFLPGAIGYHWMSNPKPASSTSFVETWAKLRLDPFRFTLNPE